MEENLLDTAKSEAFADRMLDILNGGALALMTSVGHQTGLFDTMKNLPPSTSEKIAEVAGLHERYVREWLGAMVTGGIVECNSEGRLFHLPAEHAEWLTREVAVNNIAVYAQYVPLLGAVEDQILHCFREGGGVPYSAYKRFHTVMAEDSGQTVIPALIGAILPLVPGLVEALERGIDVLDVGCGSGRALNLMAQTFPNSRFTGYDLSPEVTATATAEATEKGVYNVTFQEKDVALLDAENKFDLITAFDAIHDQARPDLVLAGIAKALRHDGVFLMQDIAASTHVQKNIGHPVGPMLYTISCMHCMSVSLAQNGMGLGAMWGEELARQMLEEAGFGRVEVKTLPHDVQNKYYLARKL